VNKNNTESKNNAAESQLDMAKLVVRKIQQV